MSTPSRPDQLMRELGRAAVPVTSSSRREVLRGLVARRVEATVDHEMRQRRGRGRWRRVATALVAAAACVLMLLGGWRWATRPPVATAPATRTDAARLVVLSGPIHVARIERGLEAISDEACLDPGDRIVTGGTGQARLVLGSGTKAVLASDTVMTLPGSVSSGAEQVDLASGSSEFSVPKLGPGRGFQVVTPHAMVVVHGTRFVVTVGRDASSDAFFTTVRVTEGVVAVTTGGRTTRLHAGDAWSSRAVRDVGPGEDAPGHRVEAPGKSPDEVGSAPAPRDSAASPGEVASSTLAAETRAFERAMALQRTGKHEAALDGLDSFLASYPRSPLVQEAQVQRFRLLKRLGRDRESAAAAREYMAEHPGGFARGEARGIVLPPAPAEPGKP